MTAKITDFALSPGKYFLSGAPVTLESNCFIHITPADVSSGNTQVYDYGSGAILDVKTSGYFWIACRIRSGQTAENLTLYPQLEVGVTATAYESCKMQILNFSSSYGLHRIPVSNGGNCTDANGQQYIADYLDFGNSRYVKNIGVIDSYAGEDIPSEYLSTTGTLSSSATILYVLQTPTVTSISQDEMAVYNALHTNKGCTTLYGSSTAHMAVSYVADTKTYIDNRLLALCFAGAQKTNLFLKIPTSHYRYTL